MRRLASLPTPHSNVDPGRREPSPVSPPPTVTHPGSEAAGVGLLRGGGPPGNDAKVKSSCKLAIFISLKIFCSCFSFFPVSELSELRTSTVATVGAVCASTK